MNALPKAKQVDALKEAFRAWSQKNTLRPGDIVCWRPRMKNKLMPRYDQPAIVLDVLSEPLVDDERDITSQYYGEPLDVRLGYIDDDGDLTIFLFDSRKFMAMPGVGGPSPVEGSGQSSSTVSSSDGTGDGAADDKPVSDAE